MNHNDDEDVWMWGCAVSIPWLIVIGIVVLVVLSNLISPYPSTFTPSPSRRKTVKRIEVRGVG